MSLAVSSYSSDAMVARPLIKPATVQTKPVTFKYNRLFGGEPSNETNEAWEALFPVQGGFFRHPKLASKRSALSVFHQLHCLVSLAIPVSPQSLS